MTKKEIVAAALNSWTRDKFCTSTFAVDSTNHSVLAYDDTAIKWCALGRLRKVVGPGDGIPYDIFIDFRGKYNKGLCEVNDGWFGYWCVKRMLRKLYD